MATMDEIRAAGKRESARTHARDVGCAGNVVADEAEEIAKLGTALYAAAEARDFREIAALLTGLHERKARLEAELTAVDDAVRALAEAEG